MKWPNCKWSRPSWIGENQRWHYVPTSSMISRKRRMLSRNHILVYFLMTYFNIQYLPLVSLINYTYEMAQADLWKTGEELKRLGVDLKELGLEENEEEVAEGQPQAQTQV